MEAGNQIPGVLHPGEGDRIFSGTLHSRYSSEDIRKRNLPGLDPWTAQRLATLLCLMSMAKETMITSFKVMNLLRQITAIFQNYTDFQLFNR